MTAKQDIPAKIDHYEVERELARGGMGVVYTAFEPSLGRRVALKVVSKSLAQDKKALARFDQEARASADLKHANIVSIYFRGSFEGSPYFAMEFVEGESLSELLSRGALEPAVALDYLIQTCLGLEAAADKGLIHRDIKPANLMLTNRGIVKITDFGLAKALEGDGDLTTSGLVVGTPHYMSPEQAQGMTCDCRSDIYSLGATFYHLLSGRKVFEKSSITAVLLAHVNEETPKLRSICPSVPAPLCNAINRMLAKDPIDRFQNYGELLDHLKTLEKTVVCKDIEQTQTIACEKSAISIALDDKTVSATESSKSPVYAAGTVLKVISFSVSFGVAVLVYAHLLRFWNLLIETGVLPWIYRPSFPVSLGCELAYLSLHVVPRALCFGAFAGLVARYLKRFLDKWRSGTGLWSCAGIILGLLFVDSMFTMLAIDRGHPVSQMSLPYSEQLGLILTVLCTAPIAAFFSTPLKDSSKHLEASGVSALSICLHVTIINILWGPLGFGAKVFERAYALGASPLAGSFLFATCWLGCLLPLSIFLAKSILPLCGSINRLYLRLAALMGMSLVFLSFPEVFLVSYHPPGEWFLAGVGGLFALILFNLIHLRVLEWMEPEVV